MSQQQTPPPASRAMTRTVRLLGRLSSLAGWLLLIFLLVLALYAGVGRLLTADMNQYRDTVENQLSEQLGYTVSIGDLSSRWYWLDPEVSAQNVTFNHTDARQSVLHLQHFRLRVNFLASLMRVRLVFEDVEADGLDIALRQKASGEITLRGADFEMSEQSFQYWVSLADRWLAKPFIRITRIQVALTDGSGNLRQLDIPQLDLLYYESLVRASGRAMQAGTDQQLASFRLVGQRFLRGQFTGQVYLDIASGRLFDGLFDDYRWRGMRVEGFDVGGQAWLNFRDGQLDQVSGSLQTPYLQLGVGAMSLAPLEDIRARFGWRRDEPEAGGIGQWHLQQLQWRWNGDQVSPFSAKLTTLAARSTAASQQPAEVRLVADALPLRPLRRLLAALPLLPVIAQEALADYRPGGFLDAMQLDIPLADPAGFKLTGQLRDVKTDAYNGAPAASHVQGLIFVDRNGGYVDTHAGAQPVEIEFPELFSARWQFPRFKALVAWQIETGLTRVFSESIRLGVGEQTELTGSFDLRLDDAGDDNLGLQVRVVDGDAAMIADLVPEYAVAPELYNWLTTAIKAGKVSSGAYFGHGQIGSTAPADSFMSAMWYEFEDVHLVYDPEWPAVTGGRGRVEVHNESAVINIEQGSSGGLQLRPGKVQLTVEDNQPVIQVTTGANVPATALDVWMNNSPLGEYAADSLRQIKLAGNADLALDLRLPLSQPEDFTVDAHVAIRDADVLHRPTGLQWQKVRGQARYQTTHGLSVESVSAVFAEQPVAIKLDTDEQGRVTLRQKGDVTAKTLRQMAGIAAGSEYGISGKLTYNAELMLNANSPAELELSSDLRGLGIDWPDSLGKTPQATTPLRLTLDSSVKDGIAFGLNWENRAHGYVHSLATGLDVRVDYVQLGDTRLSNLDISALDLNDQWAVRVNSSLVTGRLAIPRDGSALTMELQHLNLPRRSDEENLSAVSQYDPDSARINPQNWPSANVQIDSLSHGGEALGRWFFRIRPQPGGVDIIGIEGKLKSLRLAGEFSWLLSGGSQVSRFNGTVTGGQLADLGGLLGADVPFKNTATNIELALEWPGRPDQFGIASLDGDISIRLEDGVILQQNSSAQLFRVFNLLNTDTLWRRLQLDFSDLYERGVAFDALSGKAQIADGLLTLNPELQIVGPSGAFKLSGTTDMAAESLNMRLVVVVPLTQNLPLAAILLGAGAPIGGALFVLDKLLGDPLSKLTSASYRVSGSWSEPKTSLQGVFGAGD